MAITFGTTTTKTETNAKGEKFTRICVTLYNDGDQPKKRKVSFYRELVPAGGARPAAPAPAKYLCTAEEKTVPAKKVLAHGSGSGSETFCCDLSYELEPADPSFGQEHFIAVAGMAADAKEKKTQIPRDHGTEQSDSK